MTTEPDTAPIPTTEPTTAPPTGATVKRPRGRPRKDAAPRKETAPKPPANPVGKPSKLAVRERQYTAQLSRFAVWLYAMNAADGLAFIDAIPRIAKALAAVADQNPRVGKLLDAGVKSGAWLELGAALSAIAVPIAVNHGKLPPISLALVTGDLSTLVAATRPAEPAAPAPEPADVPRGTPEQPTDPTLPDAFTVVAD